MKVSDSFRLPLVLFIIGSPSLIASQTVTTTPMSNTTYIKEIEMFGLFSTLVLFVWIIFILMLCYGTYQLVPNSCSLKSRLVGGRDQQISHTLTISLIAVEPSVGYDFDNSSIRVDLCDRNEHLIASLLMRPLWAFNSIQANQDNQDLNSIWTVNRPKASPTSDMTSLQTNNLSRQVPLIGIHKWVSDKRINKVTKIVMAHDCPHPDSTILLRCLEITNITSLTCHTYPVNAHIPYLYQAMNFDFKSTEHYEFDSSHDMPRKMRYQANSSLNIIEMSTFCLLAINTIILCSYFWSKSYNYESDEWLMWYKAVLLSLILGSLVATLYLLFTVPYRLFKEYYVLHSTRAVKVFQIIILSIVVLAAACQSMATLGLAYERITLSILLRWYRIAFLSTIIFICLSLVLTFIGAFFHIRPKPKDKNSFDKSNLEVPKMGDKKRIYRMIELESTCVKIAYPNNLTFFASEWFRRALDQHKGLDRAILCDIYDVMFLPNKKLVTNLAKNAIKIFGEENTKDANRGKAYATRIIEQKGMPVSISQYGLKETKSKKKDDKDNEENNGLVLFIDDDSHSG